MEADEDNVYFTFQHGGETIYCDRYNTLVNTYIGKLSVFNHVYIDLDINDPEANCMRIFKGSEGYNPIIDFIAKNKFMALINQCEVEEQVVDSYVGLHTVDLSTTKGIPRDWT